MFKVLLNLLSISAIQPTIVNTDATIVTLSKAPADFIELIQLNAYNFDSAKLFLQYCNVERANVGGYMDHSMQMVLYSDGRVVPVEEYNPTPCYLYVIPSLDNKMVVVKRFKSGKSEYIMLKIDVPTASDRIEENKILSSSCNSSIDFKNQSKNPATSQGVLITNRVPKSFPKRSNDIEVNDQKFLLSFTKEEAKYYINYNRMTGAASLSCEKQLKKEEFMRPTDSDAFISAENPMYSSFESVVALIETAKIAFNAKKLQFYFDSKYFLYFFDANYQLYLVTIKNTQSGSETADFKKLSKVEADLVLAEGLFLITISQ